MPLDDDLGEEKQSHPDGREHLESEKSHPRLALEIIGVEVIREDAHGDY